MNPERHYMADVSSKLAAIAQFVEEGNYFIINRPRHQVFLSNQPINQLSITPAEFKFLASTKMHKILSILIGF